MFLLVIRSTSLGKRHRGTTSAQLVKTQPNKIELVYVQPKVVTLNVAQIEA